MIIILIIIIIIIIIIIKIIIMMIVKRFNLTLVNSHITNEQANKITLDSYI